MKNVFYGKSVLVIGGTGSIGSTVVRRLLAYEPKVTRVLSNDEDGLFNLQQELVDYPNVRFLLGDVKDKERLRKAVENVNFVLHAAALKHVPLCEYNPFEAVKANVLGTQNAIEVAMEEEVEKFITISTDKAVNPVNVMGATKLLAERLTISANYYKGARGTAFSCVRFGNVLNSRGSVVPLFRQQIEKGGSVSVTDPDMTRFVISLSDAVALVLEAVKLAEGGEIFVLKMSAFRVGDLAEAMIEELAPRHGYTPEQVKVVTSGKRPGEKNHEELMTEDEAMIAYELEDMFVIDYKSENRVTRVNGGQGYLYSSRNIDLLTKEEIKEILRKIFS